MRLIPLLLAIVAFPSAAYANPVSPTDVLPDTRLLSALLVEVLMVILVLWRCRLRIIVLLPCWYVVNLLSFYVLFPGFQNLFSVFGPGLWAGFSILLQELSIILTEGATLYAVCRLQILRATDSQEVPLRRALVASLLGNAASAITYGLFSFWR